MQEYKPEIGQILFGQHPQRYRCPDYVESGLASLGYCIEAFHGEETNPTLNNGSVYENSVFKMEAYSWSDEEQEFNFCHFASGLKVSWYKYLFRGSSINKDISRSDWSRILMECMQSVSDEAQKD